MVIPERNTQMILKKNVAGMRCKSGPKHIHNEQIYSYNKKFEELYQFIWTCVRCPMKAVGFFLVYNLFYIIIIKKHR